MDVTELGLRGGVDRGLTNPASIRRLLVVLPFVMATALMVTVVSTYRQVKAVSETAAIGQGEIWLDEVRHATRPGSRWDVAKLQEIHTQHSSHGLLCIHVFDRRFTESTAVGKCGHVDEQLREWVFGLPRGISYQALEDTMRLATRVPPPHGRRPAATSARRTQRARRRAGGD